MALGLGGLPAIRAHRREGTHRLGGNPLDGRLAGGRVAAPSGALGAPLGGVGLESDASLDGAPRPDVVPERVEGALAPPQETPCAEVSAVSRRDAGIVLVLPRA
jgi:hypothetical protein